MVVFFLPREAMLALLTCRVSPVIVGAQARQALGPACSAAVVRGSERLNVRRPGTLRALLGVIAHLRALGQRLEAVALDRAVVNEQVLAGVIRCDEPKSLVVAEPLNSSCCHDAPPGSVCSETRRTLPGNDCGDAGHLDQSSKCSTTSASVARTG